MGEVLRRLRPAMLRQVVRRGAQQAMVVCQLARDQRGIGQRADADGEVEAAADQIEHMVGQADAEAHAGMGAQEQRRVPIMAARSVPVGLRLRRIAG